MRTNRIFYQNALFALGCLGVVGCSDLRSLLVDGKATLHGDVAFTPEERTQIQKGADFWCTHTHGSACVSIAWDADSCGAQNICRTHTGDGRYNESTAWVGVSSAANASMAIDVDKAQGEHLFYTAAHELGHLLDFEHTPSGIMCGVEPCENLYAWTPEIEEQCKTLGYCR